MKRKKFSFAWYRGKGVGVVKKFPGIESYGGREVIPDKTDICTIDCTPWNEAQFP